MKITGIILFSIASSIVWAFSLVLNLIELEVVVSISMLIGITVFGSIIKDESIDKEKEDKKRAGKILLNFSLLLAVFFIFISNIFSFSFGLYMCMISVFLLMFMSIDFLYGDKFNENKMKNWPLVVGTITQIYDSSVYIRTTRIQYLRITVRFWMSDGELMTASTNETISKMGRFQQRLLVSLRYNPQKPEKFKITFNEDPELLQDALKAYWIGSGLVTREEMNIYENGEKTIGVILSGEPPIDALNEGFDLYDRIEMAFQVNVAHLVNDDKFSVTINKTVPKNMLPFVQPGSVVEVFYMPENMSNCAIRLVLPQVYVSYD